MKVELIHYTHRPAEVIAEAARRCYAAEDIHHGNTAAFLRFLQDRGHLSPFEFADFQFHIQGISRVCSHQLVRHRIASYCQQSQRYSKVSLAEPVLPFSIVQNMSQLNAQYAAFWRAAIELDATMAALDIPREDRRYLWPQGEQTAIMVKMNARSLLNFFRLRCDDHAQEEIREMAKLMREQAERFCPEVEWK